MRRRLHLWEQSVLKLKIFNGKMSNVELGDTIEHEERPDDGLVITKFGDSDDNDPTSGERYTQVLNKAWEDKRRGISPMVTTKNADFYG
ncbi:RPM1-interacting protein 4-like protein isoform X2 [Tanacetum coccineum]